MIFKCFVCDQNVIVDDLRQLFQEAEVPITECKHCGARYETKQFKNRKTNIVIILRKNESED